MNFPIAFIHGSTVSLIVFVAICAGILIAFITAAHVTSRSHKDSYRVTLRLCISIGVYCVLIACILASGLLDRAFIPFGPIFLLGTVSIAIVVGFTRVGTNIATGIPLAWLVGFQGFRLPLELVLHDWHAAGTIPETMSWTGSNWDILTGILACLMCAFVGTRHWLAWVFNIVGIILLANVGRVAIMSSPLPFGWQVDPPLELIRYFPYAYIVPICVGGAALGHVLLTRCLVEQSAHNRKK
jgi:hypothetical protein